MAVKALWQKISFVLPDDRDQPSGGNIYNEYLINALKKAGQEISICTFAQYLKALQNNQAGIYGVDSLFVNALNNVDLVKAPATFSFFILHHLESLHPPAGQSGDIIFQTREKSVLEHFDLILTSSDFSRQYLLQKNLDVPAMVVEPALYKQQGASHLPEASLPLRALMISNVVERKGIFPWLQSLLQHATQDDSFMIDIVGRKDMEPDYYASCLRLVNQSFLKTKVKFLGAMPHEEVLRQHRQHHLLVSAAYMETYGMAIQEACSQGLPILVLEGGFSGKHIQGGNGILCADIFELTGNFLQLSRNQSMLEQYLNAARSLPKETTYRWEDAAAIFLNQIHHFL